jgi:hypothetical protein
MFEHENGAKRGEQRLRYDLIPFEALEAYAKRATIGAEKYGDFNWQKGGQDFFTDAIGHLIHHLFCWKDGILDDEKEIDDHLGAVIWNAGSLLWARKRNKLKLPYEK